MIRNPHRGDNITITLTEYYKLKRSQAMLNALDVGGVDNWEWYSEAYQEYSRDIKGKPWSDVDDEDTT